jgi:hypothetical protein
MGPKGSNILVHLKQGQPYVLRLFRHIFFEAFAVQVQTLAPLSA